MIPAKHLDCNLWDLQRLLLCSYPREARELGAVQFQTVVLQRPLVCGEASQRAATILQEVRQLGLQPLNSGSCHGGRAHSSTFTGPRELTRNPSKEPQSSVGLQPALHPPTISRLVAFQMVMLQPAALKCNLTPLAIKVSGYSVSVEGRHPHALIGSTFSVRSVKVG